MSKLFLFGIGGTGSRVIKSFLMLLASGVKTQSQIVIPIIIDPDAQNGDLLRTEEILQLYNKIHKIAGDVRNEGFFVSKIAPLGSLQADQDASLGNSFHLNMQNTLGKSFSEFIEFNQIQSKHTKDLVELLYSDNNLRSPLTAGFLGSPNVGSVVLRYITDSAIFKFFTSNFSVGDKIFIISSIFGGTGAAGFPLLVNLFRSNIQSGSGNAISNAPIGALTITPYFKVTPDDKSNISSDVFITKTKEALLYYTEHLKGVNSLYYLGDMYPKKENYINSEGGKDQQNLAHFIELAGALAILDYDRKNVTTNDNFYYEFAIHNDSDTVTFNDLGEQSKKLFFSQLTQMFLFAKESVNKIKNIELGKLAWANKIGFTDERRNDFFNNLLLPFFEKHFLKWLEELSKNSRKFVPFDLSITNEKYNTAISNLTLSESFWKGGLVSADIEHELNKASKSMRAKSETSSQFIDIWWKATKEIAKNKFHLN